ncbi:unnamed protein product [Schistosoma turkestanicum]|nr:unnamed protein product [Schistosoma turkestanicum]CAH8507617.1 unnamed protein product [Schistosoma turkestanicum]
MMFTVASKLLIQICLLAVIHPYIFECLESCSDIGKFEQKKYAKTIFENASYKKVDNYYYCQILRRQQPRPVVEGNFVQLIEGSAPNLLFPIKYYGMNYDSIESVKSEIYIPKPKKGEIYEGVIFAIPDFSVLQKTEYLSTSKCDENIVAYSTIFTPSSWMTSGTLVEYEPTTQFCSIQQSNQSCFAATTSDFTCYWCPVVDKCSNGYDRYAAIWKENVCHSNKENLANPPAKSRWYLHVFIPTVSLLVIVSVVGIFASWINRRKSNKINT